ncbi:NAD(P)/FAD-dependent oxidoreductase [uncultured Clostridium sp.]|uniref:phytoene desaturase family protein n=1 Tax=uncultured Clostridium sp. TaxID=59620 RepID=UPI002602F873|nr:phytoene desaturase family protein [uncultured Clostridium sp.]
MKTIVVGAGIGGLCTAIRLLNKGLKVLIIEKEDTIGGRVNIKEKDGFKFDLTASVLMNEASYINIFEECGRNYRDYIEVINQEHTYRVNYSDGSQYDFYSNKEKMDIVLERMQEGLSFEYNKFVDESFRKYLLAKKYFLDKPMISIFEFLSFQSIFKFLDIKPVEHSYKFIKDRVSCEKLREYLIFKTMYIGTNPYGSSNIYTLIPAITQKQGLFYIKGGVYAYVKALEKLIYELGGEIKVRTEVTKIVVDNKRIVGVNVDGKFEPADIVIGNSDYSYTLEKLLEKDIKEVKYKKNNLKDKEYSCSTFILYLGLNKKINELKLHNIYLSKDFKLSIEGPFKGYMVKDVSLYLYYPSAVDDSFCEMGKSSLNIMLRVPNLSFEKIEWNTKNIKIVRDNIINTIATKIRGLEEIEKSIEIEEYLIPKDFESKFNCYYGNAFGLSHKLSQTNYLRGHMKSKNIKGLYFIGASTHPGNGISVVIDGTKVLENIILKDLM